MTYTFDNYPSKVTEEFYAIARNHIISYYSNTRDVISIYEYGSVSSPGVSDLDIILVLKDKVHSRESDIEFSNISSDVNSLVVDGTVMKMPERVFSKINYFDQFNLAKLSGKEIALEGITESDKFSLEVISVIDWLPERILRLTRMLNNEVINISNILCILHSFSYSIEKINKLTNDNHNSDNVLSLIQSLRNEWYSIEDPEESLIECIRDSITLGYRYLCIFKEYLDAKDIFRNSIIDQVDDIKLELFKNHFVIFVSQDDHAYLEKTGLSISNSSEVFVSLPNFFYPHFYNLSSQKGLLSDVMKNKINPYTELTSEVLSDKYKTVLTNKMNLAEENAQFLKVNNFKRGLIRYGFHLTY